MCGGLEKIVVAYSAYLWMILKWRARKKRLPRIVIVMAQRGRVHGRPRRQENVEDVNDIIVMMRTRMARMDSIEVAQRRGITHVIRDDNDDEEELETIKEEQMTME